MTNFKLYNRIVWGLIGSFLISIVGLGLYMDPHSGELTRMGGYLENDFGANLPQDEFVSPLFKRATSLDKYDRYYDVVVLGDSFSNDLVRGWQNYLVMKTGWSVISFDMNRISLDDLVNTEIYQNKPPKFFIYETIERNLISRHPRCADNTNIVPRDTIREPISTSTVSVPIRSRARKSRELNWRSIDLGLALNYSRKALARSVLRRNVTEVHQFLLNRSGLFSNREDSRLLVVTRDFKLIGVSEQQIETAKCRLLEIQREIQSIEQIAFLVLIFPDKTSVYADYINGDVYTDLSVASEFENTTGLNVVKLKGVFDNAVNDGVIDLYLPNDTHCGFYGYRLAAEAVLEAMAKKAWIE